MTTEYEAAEREFLDRARRRASSADLAEAASAVHAAAKTWESEAYREYFASRERLGDGAPEVIELEIDAERAELLAGLWFDLAAAFGET